MPRSAYPMFLIAAFVVCVTADAADSKPANGWRASPERVEALSERQKEFNYREENVPEYTLPDPLVTAGGERITSPEAWREKRRPEILDLFREHVYGREPGPPEELRFEVVNRDENAMGGAATLKEVDIVMENRGRSLTMRLTLFTPNAVEGPAPTFLLINNRDASNTDPTRREKSGFWPAEEVVARGYGIAAFQNSDIDPDKHDGFQDGIHALFREDREEGAEHAADAWGTLAAWAWGASRAMDYFETDPDVDETRVAVLGHSRGGKTALWAGARDERFAIVISNESGCGGAALSRRRYGETVARINRSFPHWFCENFNKFNDNEDELPVDQHMLIGLIAPRGVYVASADEDLWADPRGEFLALANASPVYALWGLEGVGEDEMPPLDTPLHRGRMGYHVRSGGHNLTPYDWEQFMNFADRLWRADEGE